MRFKVLWIAGLMLAAGGMLSPSIAHGGMTITSSSVYVNVYNSSGGAGDSFSGNSFPTSQLVDATDGDFYSRMQADYSQSGGGATLSYDFSQKRSGDYYDYAQGYTGIFAFTVDANTTYSLSGNYDVTDVTSAVAGQAYVEFYGFLRDATTNTVLFESDQVSDSTTNESFILGGTEGDSYYTLAGSPTGNLIAGHSYTWGVWAITQTYNGDGGASAVGNINLVLGSGGSPVPEPTSIAMWGIGAIGLVFACRKRQQMKLAA